MSWVTERIAAEKLDYHPRVLRAYAKSGKLKIAFTHFNHRKYKYAVKDINKVLNENASQAQ